MVPLLQQWFWDYGCFQIATSHLQVLACVWEKEKENEMRCKYPDTYLLWLINDTSHLHSKLLISTSHIFQLKCKSKGGCWTFGEHYSLPQLNKVSKKKGLAKVSEVRNTIIWARWILVFLNMIWKCVDDKNIKE